MSIKEATHKDVIEYTKRYSGAVKYYEELDGKLFVLKWIEFEFFDFSTLPHGLVFTNTCDFDDSQITTLPDDIVLQRNLYLNNSKIETLPVLNITQSLIMNNTKFVIPDGTYIGDTVRTRNTIYETLDSVYINGYFFSTGILS